MARATMTHRWARAIACVLLIPVLLARSSTAECSFEYRRQPPSTTENDCRPYDMMGKINIALECVVRRLAGVNTTFMIRWFRENTTGAVEDLGLGDPLFQQDIDRTSRYHQTAFFNQAYSPSLLGKYWCQVINTTADPDQPLMRSNVFTLLAPEDYSRHRCMGTSTIQQVDDIACADEPELTSPSTTIRTHSTTVLQPSPTSTDTNMMRPHTTALSPAASTQAAAVGHRSSILATVMSRSSTPLPTTLLSQEEVPPFLYAVASVGAIFLVIIIVLVVGIVIMLTMKRRSKGGGEGIDNNTYGMSTPEDYAEPVLTLPRPPAPGDTADGAVYADVGGTPPQHVIQNGFVYSVVAKKPAAAAHHHDDTAHQAANSPYSKLDHSVGASCSPPANEFYSSLEDSTAPLYNTLQQHGSNGKMFDDPDYSNIAPKHPESTGEVHPHYTGNYERATNYQPPAFTAAGQKSNGIYEVDPDYQAITS